MGFFDLDVESHLTRVEQLVAKDKNGSRQAENLSDHSPGPVSNEELLARSLDYPNKFDSSGGLNDSLFQDAFTYGASCQRLKPDWDSCAAAVHARFEARAEARRTGADGRPPAPGNLYVGAVHVNAAELRACVLDGEAESRVRVYDAGNPGDALHAEVMVDAAGLARDKRKELRVRLMALAEQRGLFVSPYLPVEQHARAVSTQCNLHMPKNSVERAGASELE